MPLGSFGDVSIFCLYKTFGLPDDLAGACAHLHGTNTFAIDVGKITFLDGDGNEAVRYFPNIAEVGLGGAVVARAARLADTSPPAQAWFKASMN